MLLGSREGPWHSLLNDFPNIGMIRENDWTHPLDGLDWMDGWMGG